MDDFRTPEDLFKVPDEFAKQAKENWQKLSKKLPIIVVGVVLFFGLLTSFYTVGPNEIGVVRRFGKYVRSTKPGLHLKIPYAEVVNNVKVAYVFKQEFGYRTEKAGVKTRYSSKQYFDESIMLTGDLNVLEVEWIVQFTVKDPVKLLFNIRKPDETIRNISEAVMRQVVGDYSVNEVLTTKKLEINEVVQAKFQEIMDIYQSGIRIDTVKLQDVNPPDEVKPSFNEVNAAKQEKDKLINQAWEAYNKIIPKAKGEAEKTISEAEGYALKRVNTAKGDAAKFIATYDAYKNSKEVTKKRMYLETMDKILPRVGKKFVLDENQKGILPLMNLTEKGGAE